LEIKSNLVWQEKDGIQKCAIIASNGCFIEFNETGDLIANKREADEVKNYFGPF
jgi:hypothetical protein